MLTKSPSSGPQNIKEEHDVKKGILVGINRYKIPGVDLRGCINDVKNMSAVIRKFCGFKANDITVLIDYAATTTAMPSALVNLIRDARTELRRSSRARRKKTDTVQADIPEVLVTGCRDTQTSADACIGNSYDGALTYYLVETLSDPEGQISCRDLHSKTATRLKAGDYEQVPQLEGRKSRFDQQFLSPVT